MLSQLSRPRAAPTSAPSGVVNRAKRQSELYLPSGDVSHKAASDAIVAVHDLLVQVAEQIIGTTFFHVIDPFQYPFLLEQECNDQGQFAPVFVFNVQIEAEPA